MPLPSPASLRRKILIKNKKKHDKAKPTTTTVAPVAPAETANPAEAAEAAVQEQQESVICEEKQQNGEGEYYTRPLFRGR